MSAPDATPEPAVPPGRDLKQVLHELLRQEHVAGGLIVAPDGLVIAAQLPSEVPVEAVSALAAMLGRELELRGPRLRRGSFLMAQFAAGDGTVFLGGTPVGFIVLLAEAAAGGEKIRRALRSAVESVRQAFAR
jgi:predicted regulator of Ras-like GTPase activity (Roadblock/LC7/MglB family)